MDLRAFRRRYSEFILSGLTPLSEANESSQQTVKVEAEKKH
ncbi:hypothetical protein [Enterococcus mundtii]|nr:hypothetical protein [Enterococcus mundtii]